MIHSNVLVNINDSEFAHVIKENELVLIGFWAPWCNPCIAFLPTLETLAMAYVGKVKIYKLNIDDNPTTTVQQNIKSLPTLILFKQGIKIKHWVGIQSTQELETILKLHVSS